MEVDRVYTKREIFAELLELYRDLPCLWNFDHENYNNREVRHQAHIKLLKCYMQYDPTATISDVKKKLENMRAAYKRERRKVEKSLCEGSEQVNIHVPSLWYYPYLTFLDNELDPITIIEEYYNNNDGNSDDKSDAKSDEPDTKRSRSSSILQTPEHIKKELIFNHSAKSVRRFTSNESSADAFGRSVSCQLKELPKLQRCLAEKLIGEVLFHAKLDELNMDTVIYLNDS